jgi:GTP 3',8-cyclase
VTNQEPLVDSFGRCINYLRASLTEACNFRCVYCALPSSFPTLPTPQYLTCQKITRFVRIAGRFGIDRVRLTGDEPLLRKDILEVVRCLKEVDTIRDLSITTNGSFLEPLVQPLKEAGETFEAR